MKLPEITIATSVRYGNYKQHYQNALSFVETISKKFDEICNYINLPRKLFINIRPIRGAYGRAFYLTEPCTIAGRDYMVEIDARQSRDLFEDSLLHELVHIEQFYEGRLDGGKPGHFKWNKKDISFITASFEEYNNLPWEREANERAKILKKVIFSIKN
jgi:hypothetical protein